MSEEQNAAKDEEPKILPEQEEGILVSDNEIASQADPVISPPSTDSETPAMEVHHHPHVHHSKKWKDYLFEFFMLFLAVTAGFLMENQREHYVEHQRVKQYARSLVSDLRKDTAMINVELRQLKRAINQIDSFSAYFENKELNQVNNFDLLCSSAFSFYRPYTWSRATLDQIKSSGSLRYFDNDSIVYKISAYDAQTRHMDYDYSIDLSQATKTRDKKEQLINMNYPGELIWLLDLGTKLDSLKNTAYYEQMRRLNKPLLTKDINEINILVNQSLLLKNQLTVRVIKELPELKNDAAQLIEQLTEEYSFK